MLNTSHLNFFSFLLHLVKWSLETLFSPSYLRECVQTVSNGLALPSLLRYVCVRLYCRLERAVLGVKDRLND